MLLLLLAPAATAADRTVFPGNGEGWATRALDDGGDGTATTPPTTGFELGPATPPLGLGSLQLSVGNQGSSAAEIRNTEYNGTRLDAIAGLSYSSYTDVDGTGDQAPYIILQLDHDDDNDIDDLFFFEPVYQNGFTTDVPTQANLVDDAWQTWNARIGGWYSALGVPSGGGPGANVITIDEYLAVYPNAEIRNSTGGTGLGGLRLVTGFGAGAWNGFVGNVDNFAISTATVTERFDFEPDTDADGVPDSTDNCPAAANADQANADGDAQGDACDGDDDNDGDADGADNCPTVANADQANNEGDAQGDACDADDDNDGISDAAEAATGTSPTDPDADDDGVNDSADSCPKTPGTLSNGCPATPPDDAPPAIQITAPAANSSVNPATGVTLTANATDDKGVTQVAFIDADGVLCTDASAPYSCDYKPTGDDVGKNTVIAVASDAAGQTGTDQRRLNVSRFPSGKVSLGVSPRRDTSTPYRFTLSGKVTLPAGVTTAQGCRGTVVLRITRGRRSVAATNAPLRSDCTYSRALGVRAADAGSLRATARFNGNAVIRPRSASAVTARAG
jgi:hypothetical protein